MKIKAAYDANDIMIPFPIRTMDFGIKGGVSLADVIPPMATPGTKATKIEI